MCQVCILLGLLIFYKIEFHYNLFLFFRYRASTHYRPDLTPTERAQKLTALLHHIANLVQNTVQVLQKS